MENLIIIGVHVAVFVVLAVTSCLKPQLARSAPILACGFLCVPIFGLTILAMLDFSNHGGGGTHGMWFLILSVMTLGLLPVVTLASAGISGVCAMRMLPFFGRLLLPGRRVSSEAG